MIHIDNNYITAIILAGGKSRRFGTDKALYPIAGVPLIQHAINRVKLVTDEIIIITDSLEKTRFLPHPCYTDLIENSGPLAGIYTGLMHSRSHYNLVLACDMPLVNTACLAYLIDHARGYDVTVPLYQQEYQPLCAIYAKTCIPVIAQQLAARQLQVFQFYPSVNTKTVPINQTLSFYHDRIFYNINTQQDFHEIRNSLYL